MPSTTFDHRTRILTFFVLTLASTSSDAVLGDYVFTRIAETGNVGINAADPVPAINNSGEVAFRASLSTYNNGQGVYKGDGGPLMTIAQTGYYGTFSNLPAINDAGEVAFWGQINSGPATIYRGDGSIPLTTVAQLPGPYGGGGFTTAPAIANDGTVAFQYNNNPFFGGVAGTGIFAGSGGTWTQVVSVPAVTNAGSPVSSDDGRLVFSFDGLNGDARGLYVTGPGESGPLQTVQTFDNLGLGLDSYAVNDDGTVVYIAHNFGQNSLYRFDGGITDLLADPSGSFSSFGSVSLNNQGLFAFSAALDTGSSGIYVGLDPSTDAVIQVGDALDGSFVTHLSFGSSGLNDSGELAFYALLADGRRGIYTATAVPEPGSLSLGAAAAILFAARGILVPGRRREHSKSTTSFKSEMRS